MKSKVLLIDDSVTIHRVIDLSIDIDRYDIVKVFSKEDAALKMQSEQYDYILLDNKLDNIIITEYIKELKVAQPSASIILLVGAFDRFDESDLEKTGAEDYLVKPFDSQSLNEKLSSDADMMPAGIVEKIAEADFARDNDDYIAPTASLTTGEIMDGLSKEEYLENLEEVQPDDLTDNGYVEDLDTVQSLEFDKQAKEVEEVSEQIQEDEQTETVNFAEENNIIEENPEEDIIVTENSEEEQVNIDFDETDKETDLFDNAITSEENIEPALEQVQETAEEIFNETENEEVLDIPVAEETSSAEKMEVEETATSDSEMLKEMQEENTLIDSEEIDIPNPVTAVHNTVLPDIDNVADISDEYVMQDNLEEIDNVSQTDMLNEFPDFPDVDDISTEEIQDTQDISDIQAQENLNAELPNIEDVQEEVPTDNNIIAESADDEIKEPLNEEQEKVSEAEQNNETLLVDDDDWLSDAPAAQDENISDVQEEKPQLELSEENLEENEFIDSNTQTEMESREETISEMQEEAEQADEETVLFENNVAEEAVDTFDKSIEEPVQEEEIREETVEEVATPEIDELPEMPSLEEMSNIAEPVEIADENSLETIEMVEDTSEPSTEEVIKETFEESLAEETSFDTSEISTEDSALNEEQVLPIQKEEIHQEQAKVQQTEIKQAEEYNPETSGRFGGITVTISRDEIIAMLGNAIDKHFLEEAVKEVIASNMKEIVRNIVPAIAEKYIKEEIERLKNDE